MPDTNTNPNNFFKSTPFFVFIAAVAIVALGWYSGLFKSLLSIDPAKEPGDETARGPEFELYTPPLISFVQGAPLPEGFPAGLILDDDAALIVGIVSPGATTTPDISASTKAMLGRQTVKWSSNMSVSALFSAYTEYFADNSWTVVEESTSPEGNARAIHATKGSASVSISISPSTVGSQVTVAYEAN